MVWSGLPPIVVISSVPPPGKERRVVGQSYALRIGRRK